MDNKSIRPNAYAKDSMMELSIIVPVYNVEAELPLCIDSIIAQTRSDFEAILVDDGSSDQSGKIIDEYAQKDSRIVVIHQENKGVSEARNAGLQIAKGKYIGFIDPDDWVEPSMYAYLLSSIQEADLAACNINVVSRNGISHSRYDLPNKLNNKKEVHDKLLSRFFTGKYFGLISVFNKVYRHSMLKENNIWFDSKLSRNEDGEFNYRVLQCASSFVFIDKPLYYYNAIREGSLYKRIDENQYEVWKKDLIEKEEDGRILGFGIEYNSYYSDFLMKSLFHCLKLAKNGRYDLIKSMLQDEFYLNACRYPNRLKLPFRMYFILVCRFNSFILFGYWVLSKLNSNRKLT